MTVTKIMEISTTRKKIYLENQVTFVLYKGELRTYHIQEGQEIAPADLEQIMKTVLPKRAKLRCMNLLKSREYTRHQLSEKLIQGGYPEPIAEEALEYAASFNYINDERYTRNFIEYHSENKSRRRMEQDLLKRGITKEVFQKVWSEWEKEGGRQNEAKMIRELLQKKKYDAARADGKEKQRMFAFLFRKGFSPECIQKEMNCMVYDENK